MVQKVLENCNQVKVSLLTKKLLEVKYTVLTKKVLKKKQKSCRFKTTQVEVFPKAIKQKKNYLIGQTTDRLPSHHCRIALGLLTQEVINY